MIKNLLYLFFILSAIPLYEGKDRVEKAEFFCNTLAPANVVVTNVLSSAATVNWANDPTTSNYVLRYRPVGNFPWSSPIIPTGQDFFVLTGLMSCTLYEVQVAKFCNNVQGTWSTLLVFNTLSPDSCTSSSTNPALMHISTVNVTPFPGSGLSPMISNSSNSSYTDYRPDPTRKVNLIVGSTNNIISVTKAGSVIPATANVTVWIDFNGNGIFENAERILIATSNTNSVSSISFNVPVILAKCEVTMRVIYSDTAIANGCGVFGYGEVEDYGVFFTTTANLSVNETTSNNKISIHPIPVSDILNVYGISESVNFEIYNTLGQIVDKGVTKNKTVNVQNLVKGVYFIQLKNKENPVRLKFIKK